QSVGVGPAIIHMHRRNERSVDHTPDIAVADLRRIMSDMIGQRRNRPPDILDYSIWCPHQVVMQHVVENALLDSPERMPPVEGAELAHHRQNLGLRAKNRSDTDGLLTNHLCQ